MSVKVRPTPHESAFLLCSPGSNSKAFRFNVSALDPRVSCAISLFFCVFPLTRLSCQLFSGTISPELSMAGVPVLPADSRISWPRRLAAVLGLLVLVYFADFSWYELRLHFPRLGAATGSVHRIRLLAIPNKGDKTTFELDMVHPEEDVLCSHSLLPQGGARPCWYVARHANDPIPI